MNILIHTKNKSYEKNLTKYQNNFVNSLDKLILVNPLNIMKKGYTLVYKNDKLVTTSVELLDNDEIKIQFSDGVVNANVKKIN